MEEASAVAQRMGEVEDRETGLWQTVSSEVGRSARGGRRGCTVRIRGTGAVQ